MDGKVIESILLTLRHTHKSAIIETVMLEFKNTVKEWYKVEESEWIRDGKTSIS